MTWIDIFIGILLLMEAFRGWKKGFMAEIGTIVGIFFAYFLASLSNETMASFLLPVTNGSILGSRVLAFLLTFLAVFALILILSKIFEGFLKVIALDWLNTFAGVVFCTLRGALVLSIVLNIYQKLDTDCSLIGQKTVQKSLLYKPIRKVAPAMFPSTQLFHHEGEPQAVKPKHL